MIEFITCSECGIYWGVPEHYLKSRCEDKGTFYCPNGHGQVFIKSLVEKEREARQRAEQRLAQKEDELREEKAAKEKVERKLKRLNRGVCTCCKRLFQNLKRHMETKHPEVVGLPKLKVVK